MSVAVNYDDFRLVIKSGEQLYFDKSELILNFIRGPGVTLVTRPRRFGKSLNLSMLYYFFSNKNSKEHAELFRGLNIWNHENARRHQGKYPVIHLTFVGISSTTWLGMLIQIAQLVQSALFDMIELLDSERLPNVFKSEVNKIFNECFGVNKLENCKPDSLDEINSIIEAGGLKQSLKKFKVAACALWGRSYHPH
ncbi:MAG: AAA family ATPase [Clostridiales bacterium]|jgi:hypothetical protein|nr:AAA family ATPase [Clostridiales bacterium]